MQTRAGERSCWCWSFGRQLARPCVPLPCDMCERRPHASQSMCITCRTAQHSLTFANRVGRSSSSKGRQPASMTYNTTPAAAANKEEDSHRALARVQALPCLAATQPAGAQQVAGWKTGSHNECCWERTQGPHVCRPSPVAFLSQHLRGLQLRWMDTSFGSEGTYRMLSTKRMHSRSMGTLQCIATRRHLPRSWACHMSCAAGRSGCLPAAAHPAQSRTA